MPDSKQAAPSDTEENADDDGVVTSAPASSVGSLLTDLLSEAQREVEAERESLDAQIADRIAQETAEKDSSESQKREEMQRKLIEETRRRNEALTRKQRSEATAQAIKDAQPMLASAEAVGDFEGRAKSAASSKIWMLVGTLAIIAAGGLAVAFVGATGDLKAATEASDAVTADLEERTEALIALEKEKQGLATSLATRENELSRATTDRQAAEKAGAATEKSLSLVKTSLKKAIEGLPVEGEKAVATEVELGKMLAQLQTRVDTLNNRLKELASKTGAKRKTRRRAPSIDLRAFGN